MSIAGGEIREGVLRPFNLAAKCPLADHIWTATCSEMQRYQGRWATHFVTGVKMMTRHDEILPGGPRPPLPSEGESDFVEERPFVKGRSPSAYGHFVDGHTEHCPVPCRSTF